MYSNNVLTRLEQEIRQTIRNERPLIKPSAYKKNHNNQTLTSIFEGNNDQENIESALNIVYAASSFMSVDRITKSYDDFKRNRRIIYYLDSRMGQIGSMLLIHLLKCNNNQQFSKHELVQQIDKEVFQAQGINVSTGEITEALSRMFRKTMNDFFEVQGRNLVKKPYILKIQEIKLNNYRTKQYDEFKNYIDNISNELMFRLNRMML